MGPALSAAQAPLRLGLGSHLFLDDYLIAESTNLERVICQPERLPEPIVTGPEDKCFQPYVTVVCDAEAKRFRIWYGVPESASQSHLGYMESSDGIHWLRPHRVLNDPCQIQFGVSILDEGAAYAPRERRFKYGYYGSGGLQIAASANGLDWTNASAEPVLRHDHDINCIFRDPHRQQYVAMVSSVRTGPTWKGRLRIPMQSVSEDLLHWAEPWIIISPDDADQGETQFYCLGGLLVRGSLLIGMLRVLRDDLPADPGGSVAGIGYTVLAWSDDGRTWQRDRAPFLPRNPKPGVVGPRHDLGRLPVGRGGRGLHLLRGLCQGPQSRTVHRRQIGWLACGWTGTLRAKPDSRAPPHEAAAARGQDHHTQRAGGWHREGRIAG